MNGSNPSNLTVFNNELYFSASGARVPVYRDVLTNTELYKFDGTQVSLVADIFPGVNSSYPSNLTVFNNELFFSADDGTTRDGLYKFDGTKITLVTDLSLYPSELAVFNGELLIGSYKGLFKFDGMEVSLIEDVNVSFGGGGFTVFNNELFFRADDSKTGVELYKFDGTKVSLVADINPGRDRYNDPNWSYPYDFTVFNNELYFSADNGTTGQELYKLSVSSTPVPEPNAIFTLLMGSVGAGMALKRRQKLR